jgi:hypothetical protein
MSELLVDFFAQVVFPAVGIIVMALIGLTARALNKKFNTEAFTEHQHYLMDAASLAIDYAEEQAAKLLKEGRALSSSRKMDSAIEWLIEHNPSMSKSDAATLIEAVLPSTGKGATHESTTRS